MVQLAYVAAAPVPALCISGQWPNAVALAGEAADGEGEAAGGVEAGGGPPSRGECNGSAADFAQGVQASVDTAVLDQDHTEM